MACTGENFTSTLFGRCSICISAGTPTVKSLTYVFKILKIENEEIHVVLNVVTAL
jgi:hypothetical protein